MKKQIVDEISSALTGDALTRIHTMQPYFSKSHRRVADYILKNYEKAIFLTSLRLGQECGVSESSIFRFATTLGYSGFSEMQKELQDILKLRLTIPQHFKETAQDMGQDTLRNIMEGSIHSLQYTMDTLSEEMFERAAQLLSGAERVFIVGSRSSYGLAYFFAFVLNWIRNDVQAIDGSLTATDYLSGLNENDLVVAISLPRYPRSTVMTLEEAHKRGAHTIAITDTISSPLIPFAEIPLLVHTTLLAYSDNVVPVMGVITALLSAAGKVDEKRTASLLEQHDKFWTEKNIYST